MNVTTIGLVLAMHVFQAHGVDEKGKTVLRGTLKRAPLYLLATPCIDANSC